MVPGPLPFPSAVCVRRVSLRRLPPSSAPPSPPPLAARRAAAGRPDEAAEAYKDALELWRGPALTRTSWRTCWPAPWTGSRQNGTVSSPSSTRRRGSASRPSPGTWPRPWRASPRSATTPTTGGTCASRALRRPAPPPTGAARGPCSPREP
ncbi:BTAD domain-containing putative transcriptional regulator [Streptomyces sp. NPDC048389]|uniref:BTAD domain-containing putative transcriptional regulator n=1 Tax=Streptomyces sp. NPDC048389 TaxID=3154622 RepID=UPI003452DB78